LPWARDCMSGTREGSAKLSALTAKGARHDKLTDFLVSVL